VQTVRTIPNTELDITVRGNEGGACILIQDVAISGNRNVVMKEAEKILKHRDLTSIIEIKRILNAKTSDTIHKRGNSNRFQNHSENN
jgi:polyribonucleotide nucleotidyltransferase